jgi:hypothetical protein
MVTPVNTTPPVEDQQKLLDEALQVVKVQAFHMRKCLVILIHSNNYSYNC